MAQLLVAAAVALTLAGCSTGGGGGREDAGGRSPAPSPELLARSITASGLVAHLRALQNVADSNGGSRESGSPGYAKSVDYVTRQLRAAGYEPVIQRFDFMYSREAAPPRLEQVSPHPLRFRLGGDFLAVKYSGSGDVTGRLALVDFASPTSACEPSDFEGFPRGAVALVRRGRCFLFEKAQNAVAAGARAVLIANERTLGQGRPVAGTLVQPSSVPTFFVSARLGEAFARRAARGAVSVRLKARFVNEESETANVFADLRGRRAGGVVLLGAHLDSVAGGPGINDNGSGVATVLEIASRLRALRVRPERGIRFAFWAGEEIGLVGSRFYVDRLGADAKEEIAVALNLDMLGSPNFARLVYDAGGPAERAFLAWFRRHGLAARTVPLEGRSDHAPFEEAGIPVGGLFSGADEPKTAAEAGLFGGRLGEPHDRCYHRACDTLTNVDVEALEQMADAAGAVTLRLASAYR